MTNTEIALAFASLGGTIVALGLGALAYFISQQFGHFRDRSRDAAEERAYVTGRVEEAIAMAARATDEASMVRAMLESERRQALNAANARALTDRHAKNVRLRAARARRGTW